MEEQNIYDYRAKNRQRQRNIAIDQQQRTANRLHCADHQPIARLEQGLNKLSGEAAGYRALEELQKGIQADDEKHQPEQQSHHEHHDFHANLSAKVQLALGSTEVRPPAGENSSSAKCRQSLAPILSHCFK